MRIKIQETHLTLQEHDDDDDDDEISDNETHINTCNYATKSNLLNEWERFINFNWPLDKVYKGRPNYVCHCN